MANDFTEGDLVVTDDGNEGVVTGVMEEEFEFPVGQADGEDEEPETETIDASSDEPAYIVALSEGGNGVFSADSLEEYDGEALGDEKPDPKDLAGAEMAEVYSFTDKPHDYAELQKAKERLLCERHDVDDTEELVNIRGVDDPHVGFDELPDGWDRTSVLDAWASLGGQFRTCRTQMVGDIRSPDRFCAALKDEVLGTELWRNRF